MRCTHTRSLALILGVALGGCDQAFDLHRPPPFIDLDGDLVEDSSDNCVGLANPDQADADADGRGDACDGCLGCEACDRAPDRDEDGDLIPDGCDNCPAQANRDQLNRDGDDLGDACDLNNATAQHRLGFDGFGTLASTWSVVGPWSSNGDQLQVTPQPGIRATFIDVGFHFLGAPLWRIDLGIRTPASGATPADRFGIELIDPAGPTQGCFLFFNGGWQLSGVTALPISISGVFELRLRAIGTTITCSVKAATTTLTSPFSYPRSPQIFTTIPLEVTYIDLIQ